MPLTAVLIEKVGTQGLRNKIHFQRTKRYRESATSRHCAAVVVEAFSRRHCSLVTGTGSEAGWERDKLNETLAVSSWYVPIPPSSKLTQIALTYETEGLDSGPNRAFLQPALALSSPPRTTNHHHFTFSHLYC